MRSYLLPHGFESREGGQGFRHSGGGRRSGGATFVAGTLKRARSSDGDNSARIVPETSPSWTVAYQIRFAGYLLGTAQVSSKGWTVAWESRRESAADAMRKYWVVD